MNIYWPDKVSSSKLRESESERGGAGERANGIWPRAEKRKKRGN